MVDYDDIKFFYKGNLVGTSSYPPVQCSEFEDLMYNDKELATGVLNYMNSFGDPVFPKAGTDYEPETDIDNVDIHELYFWFMREIGYQMRDYDDSIYISEIPNVEIFTDEVADGIELDEGLNVNLNDEPMGYDDHPYPSFSIPNKKYPKYVSRDGYIGTFKRVDRGVDGEEIPIYRFPGGESMVDDYELERGSNDRSSFESNKRYK